MFLSKAGWHHHTAPQLVGMFVVIFFPPLLIPSVACLDSKQSGQHRQDEIRCQTSVKMRGDSPLLTPRWRIEHAEEITICSECFDCEKEKRKNCHTCLRLKICNICWICITTNIKLLVFWLLVGQNTLHWVINLEILDTFLTFCGDEWTNEENNLDMKLYF